MKLDTGVHRLHSGDSTIYPLTPFVGECYNTPAGVYRVAKARGMDLVVITDHDDTSGALDLGERFNDHLLFDLVARPARALEQVPELAA